MTPGETPRRSALLVAALTLLVAIGTGFGVARHDGDRPTGSSGVTAAASGITPAGLFGIRIERNVELRNGERASRQLAVGDPAPSSPRPAIWARALAGVPKPADDHGRRGPVSLRGPPPSSV